MHMMQSAVDSADVNGAPHLKHSVLSSMISKELHALTRRGSWLDIGAGHGDFASISAAAGMDVVLTDMSATSRGILASRYSSFANVTIREATDSHNGLKPGERFDVISMISVIHHIPRYQEFIEDLVRNHLKLQGDLVIFQDPLYYPRVGIITNLASKIAYFSWRIMKGNIGRGISTMLRRIRGKYDEDNPSDMIEYHVVRKGVDEEAVLRTLRQQFEDVTLFKYWSTQGAFQQFVGSRLGFKNTFGIRAINRRCDEAFPQETSALGH
jgi:ubiquinone/menaquinone biosynthesis C-methylase UbiE